MENCGYFEELISAELDGELSEAEKEALRAHLETCDACRAYREALRAVAGTEADLPAPPVWWAPPWRPAGTTPSPVTGW